MNAAKKNVALIEKMIEKYEQMDAWHKNEFGNFGNNNCSYRKIPCIKLSFDNEMKLNIEATIVNFGNIDWNESETDDFGSNNNSNSNTNNNNNNNNNNSSNRSGFGNNTVKVQK